jgi:transcriptional regulator with XRE-family HTH domain
MNDFKLADDIDVICELLGITAAELAAQIGVSQNTVARWKNDSHKASLENLNKLYDFAFSEGVRLNKIKEQLYREDCKGKSRIILFHGAKNRIEGAVSVEKSRGTNDFGKGFYCGENLEQSAMFVSGFPESSLYIYEFDKTGLSGTRFFVDRDWMLTIAYFRGRLSEYACHPIIRKLIRKVEGKDYILAPIADNRMFEIIDSFIDGEITDAQCQHCLSATNLGSQYVFKTEQAVRQLTFKRHCFLCEKEKKYYLNSKKEESRIGNDKVKIARKQFRGQGEYIEEILK